MEWAGQRRRNLKSLGFGFFCLWVPRPLGPLAFGFPGFKGEGTQRRGDPKVLGGGGTQRRRNPKSLAFGFLRLSVPWPLGSVASKLKEPKGEGTQRPKNPKSLAFGFLAFAFPRLWVPSPLKPGKPKVREPKGEGTQRRRNPKVKDFGFLGLWVPPALGSLAFGFLHQGTHS